jgi:S1-C subfamily serine protease
MVATGNNQTFQFNLESFDKLMPMIANCVEKVRAGGVANAGDFSIMAPKPPVVPTAARSNESEELTQTEKPAKLVNVNGTGFIVSTRGHVLTNSHVINGCVGDVHGNLTGEPAAVLRVVSKDETNDLALLQATGTFKDVAHIRTTAIHPAIP